MIVLDAYPIVALLAGESSATRVGSLLDDNPVRTLTALGLAEILDVMIRVGKADRDELLLDLATLGLLDAEATTPEIAIDAAGLRSFYYRKRTCEVSLADCIVVATARSLEAPVVTSDHPMLDVCHAERIGVIPIPERSGRLWAPSHL